MLDRLLHFVVVFLSRSPLLTISWDRCFHEINMSDLQLEAFHGSELRYSFISLGVGPKKIYFISWYQGKLKLFDWIDLAVIKPLPTEAVVNEKKEAYLQNIESKNTLVIDYEMDCLKAKIEDLRQGISNTNNKVLFYNTLVFVFISLIFTNPGNFYKTISQHPALVINTVLIFYIIINILLLIFDYFKVKHYVRSSFGTLKNSALDMHQKILAASYYMDWYARNLEHPVFVTYLRNIERYFKMLLFLIVLFMGINLLLVYSAPQDAIDQPKEGTIEELHINNNGSMERKDLDKFLHVEMNETNQEIGHIVVLSNLNQSEAVKTQYDRIITSLQTHNTNNATICEFKSELSSIPTNTVIIQLLRED